MPLFCPPYNLLFILKPGGSLKTKTNHNRQTHAHMFSCVTPLKQLTVFQGFSGLPLLITLEKTLATQATESSCSVPFPAVPLQAGPDSPTSHRTVLSQAQGFCTCCSPWPGSSCPPCYVKEILLGPPDSITQLCMLGLVLCNLTFPGCEGQDCGQCIFGSFTSVGTPCASAASPVHRNNEMSFTGFL